MKLLCPFCKQVTAYERQASDGYIPAACATILLCCPRCDDGDFHEESYLDADGRDLPPLEDAAPDIAGGALQTAQPKTQAGAS